MDRKITILCIFGGRSKEYEISLMSAGTVIPALDREKYDVVCVGITKEGKWYAFSGGIGAITDNTWHTRPSELRRAMLSPSYGDKTLYIEREPDSGVFDPVKIDAAVPVVHGAYCEDGNLQGLLSMSGIPYVGPHCASSAVSMDKVFTKDILRGHGIPMAEYTVISRAMLLAEPEKAALQAESVCDYPLFVKPVNGGSSVGASKASCRAELLSAMRLAAEIDGKVLVERCITGREVECAVLGNEDPEATVPGEIDSGAEFYDYDAKYVTDTSEAFIPARIRPESAEAIREYAVRIFRLLDCRGLSRVDFFVTQDSDGTEHVLFNEINTLPGFTKISMYPKLWNYMGVPTGELLDRLIALAMECAE